MFTLRSVSEEKETNFYLGDTYTLISKKWHPETFNAKARELVLNDESVYAIVYDQHDRELLLTKDSSYYVMTDSGRTYACVSFNAKA